MCKLIEKEMTVFNDIKANDYRAQMRDITALMEQKQFSLFCLQKKLKEVETAYRKYIGVESEVNNVNKAKA